MQSDELWKDQQGSKDAQNPGKTFKEFIAKRELWV
jgi:hypothetical protein